MDIDPLCCVSELDGVPQGPETACTEEEACCLGNGDCIMVDPLCCDEMGGVAQGGGTVCTTPEACCLNGGQSKGELTVNIDVDAIFVTLLEAQCRNLSCHRVAVSINEALALEATACIDVCDRQR